MPTIDKHALVRRQIDGLNSLDIDGLRAKFEELFGFPSTICNCDYLRRRCAYRLQEFQFGGLSQESETFLDDLIRNDDLAQLKPPKERHVTLAPGARLIREWHGKVHEVVVLNPRVYDYDGRKFKSLTAVAEHITGQHQSGLLFFGVSK